MLTNETPDQTREEMKKEILVELRHEERRRRLLSCVGCAVVELAFIFIPLYFVASAVAKSGIVDVPVLSKWQYQPAVPERLVVPDSRATSSIIKEIAASAKFDPQLNMVDLQFSESELTTIVRDALTSAGTSLPFQISEAQMAVDAGRLELFAVSPRGDRPITIRVLMHPEIVAGNLKLTVTDIVIGSLHLPGLITDQAGKLIGQILGDAISSGMTTVGTLQEVKAEPGVFSIGLVPKL